MNADPNLMATKIKAAFVVLGFAVAFTATAQTEKTNDCTASVFVQQSAEKSPSVVSPDRQYSVVLHAEEDIEYGMLRVYRGRVQIGKVELHDLSAGMFVKWAPDSRAFYFMWSNGGMIGGYELRVFRINDDVVSEVPASSKAEQDFKIHHNCKARGINVYAIKWEGADHLLIATQKYPTGDCGKDAGLFGGYLVNINNGAILRKYSDRELKAIWPKQCPSPIWPTGLWGEDELRQAKEKLKKSAH